MQQKEMNTTNIYLESLWQGESNSGNLKDYISRCEKLRNAKR